MIWFLLSLLFSLATCQMPGGGNNNRPMPGGWSNGRALTDQLVASATKLVASSLNDYQPSENDENAAPKTNRKLVKLVSYRTQVVAGLNTKIEAYYRDDCGGQVDFLFS